MLRVLVLFAVAGGSAYVAMNQGVVAGLDLSRMPVEMVGFAFATGGVLFSLRYI